MAHLVLELWFLRRESFRDGIQIGVGVADLN